MTASEQTRPAIRRPLRALAVLLSIYLLGQTLLVIYEMRHEPLGWAKLAVEAPQFAILLIYRPPGFSLDGSWIGVTDGYLAQLILAHSLAAVIVLSLWRWRQ